MLNSTLQTVICSWAEINKTRKEIYCSFFNLHLQSNDAAAPVRIIGEDNKEPNTTKATPEDVKGTP